MKHLKIILTGVALLAIGGCASAPRQSSPADSSKPTANAPESAESPTKLARTFDEAVRRGDAAWHSGDTNLALYMYVQALTFQPRDVTTLGKIGSIHEERGNLDLARKAFELAATTAPEDARATAHLGLVMLAQDDVDGADPWLRKSIAVNKTNWRVYDALGTIAQRRGQYTDALMFLQRACALAPSSPSPLMHEGSVQMAMSDYVTAEMSLQHSVDLKPTTEAWRLLGEVQAHRGQYAKAINSLLEVMDVPKAYNAVGQAALSRHDNRIALEYFTKASESSPIYFAEAQRNAALARERLTSR